MYGNFFTVVESRCKIKYNIYNRGNDMITRGAPNDYEKYLHCI